jgi:hypothetical protein
MQKIITASNPLEYLSKVLVKSTPDWSKDDTYMYLTEFVNQQGWSYEHFSGASSLDNLANIVDVEVKDVIKKVKFPLQASFKVLSRFCRDQDSSCYIIEYLQLQILF